MLDVCLLGTGGMMPLPYRHLTSLYLRYNGSALMVDCGEGTQIALKKADFPANPIDIICFTHFHADHISGLIGMLLSMGNGGRTEPLLLIGPKGLEKVVNSLRIIAPELPFSIRFQEISGEVQDFSVNGYEIHAFKVKHKILCYGYTFSFPRLGKFNPERAKELEIPVKYWNRLQHGEKIDEDGKIYTPDLVMSAPRKGLKISYVTDTLPIPEIAEEMKDSDLAILEGMYGDEERTEHTHEFKHMMMQDACRLAKKAEVPELWITHVSPAENRPQNFTEKLRKIFPNTKIVKDGAYKNLKFDDEEEKPSNAGEENPPKEKRKKKISLKSIYEKCFNSRN